MTILKHYQKSLVEEAIALHTAICDTREKYRYSDKMMCVMERAYQRVLRRARLHSACFAKQPPDSAVLENAVVETAQGATLSTQAHSLKDEAQALLNRIDIQPVEYVLVQQLLHHETDLPYHTLEEVIAIMRERGLLVGSV